MNGTPAFPHTPRCDDVTRELSAPTGRLDAEALDRHLAACVACADFARRSARLDDLWAESRPAVPADAFGALWAAVEREAAVAVADDRPRPKLLAMPAGQAPGRWRRQAIVGLLMAQAAAAAVIFLTMAVQPEAPDAEGSGPAVAEVPDTPIAGPSREIALFGNGENPIEIENSQVVVFRLPAEAVGARNAEMVLLELDDYGVSATETIASDLDLLAYAEDLGAL